MFFYIFAKKKNAMEKILNVLCAVIGSMLLVACEDTFITIEDNISIDIKDITIQKKASASNNRNSKAKLEYSINEKKGRPAGGDLPFMMQANLLNDTLVISYSGELILSDLVIKDSSEEVIIEERSILINKEKVSVISPIGNFPYFITITSPDAEVRGTITLVDQEDEE